MRKLIIITLLLAFCIMSGAKKVQVVSINYGKVCIEKHTLQKGEKFDTNSTLTWEDSGQIMKVIDLETRKIMIVAAKTLKAAKMNSIEDFLVQKQVLAARAGRLMTAQDVELYLNRQFIFLSDVYVETSFILDKEHSFFLQYVMDGDTINKLLPSLDDHRFCIDDTIFTVDGKALPPHNLQTRLYYYDKSAKQTTLMADHLLLIVEPRHECHQLLQSCRQANLDIKETESVVSDYCHTVYPWAVTMEDDVNRFCLKAE